MTEENRLRQTDVSKNRKNGGYPVVSGCDVIWRSVVLLLGLLAGTAVLAQQPEGAQTEGAQTESEAAADAGVTDIPVAPSRTEWLIEQRDELSDNFSTLAVGIDRFFAGDVSQQENESFVRLRGGAVWRRGGTLDSDSDLKLKLDLPGSKKRWKLLFESDPEEFNDLETQTRTTPPTKRQFTDTEGSTGALRFVVDETSRWKKDLDIGVRGSTPLDPFARYQLRRSEQLASGWTVQFKESMYFFNQDGWGQKTVFNIERPISEHYLWRNRIEAKYSDDDNLLETAFVVSTVHVLDDWHAIDYAVGVLAANRPVSQTTVYFINTTFRKRLYKDWLFFDIRPELAFSRSYKTPVLGVTRKYGFKADPSLTFGIDAYLWE